MDLWEFGPDKHLWQNGQMNTQFLILGVVLAIVWFLLSAMFGYYLWQFKKVEAKDGNKLYGKGMLWTTLAITIVEFVDWVLIVAFWSNGEPVFGDQIKNPDAPLNDYHALIALVVIGFVLLASEIIMMWFFLPYFGIAFDGKRILFMGEDIPYSSITKIVVDQNTRDTYVNYTRGKRAHKRLKFSAASAFGLFVQKNASLTGHDVEETDEKAYFQSLMNSDRVAEKKLDKDINDKLKNKNNKNK